MVSCGWWDTNKKKISSFNTPLKSHLLSSSEINFLRLGALASFQNFFPQTPAQEECLAEKFIPHQPLNPAVMDNLAKYNFQSVAATYNAMDGG